MIITVQPSDIIKRCLWNEYKRFCLKNKSDEEIKKFIIDDKPFIISEDDAYVIGLLKIVETDNLIHRFKIYIEELLNDRSNLFENKLFINKNVIMNDVLDFKNRFPDSFKPSFEFKTSIDKLNNKIDDFYEKLSELKIYTKIFKDKTYNFISSNSVKTLIKDFN